MPPRRVPIGSLALRACRHVRPVHIFPGGSGMERRGYHHGKLREGLIRAALSLIEGKGPGGVTFSRGRRAGGGGPAAPFRPFPAPGRLLGRGARPPRTATSATATI